MTLTTHKIRHKLAGLRFSTAHAHDVKNKTISQLLDYERSLPKKEINLASLYFVCQYLAWLLQHIQEIDDKRILPSQKVFLADAFAFCVQRYEKHKSI